jgi:hypothetical protein
VVNTQDTNRRDLLVCRAAIYPLTHSSVFSTRCNSVLLLFHANIARFNHRFCIYSQTFL